MTRLFSQTLRDAPSEAEAASHQLLLRAGFIRQLAAGIFSYLPLARKAMTRIENIIRAEMEAIGGQEITMPIVQPADLWQETGRWYQVDAEMGRLQDRTGREMVLGMTHEEVAADLARKEIHSYRQLPLMVYQIQTKWRDDPRPRSGLIRVREFTMKDAYTFDATWESLERQYRDQYQAYFNIFHRCGLPVISVAADTGMMGGKVSHEYMYLNPIGEDTLILCAACGYSANRQVAQMGKPGAVAEPQLALEKVPTPDCKTIADLARFLDISEAQTAKAVFMVGTVGAGAQKVERFIFAVVRGDMELNETKLANAVQARGLRPATEDEIRAVGAVPGYASPLGLKGVLVVVDDLAAHSANLVSGANEAGYHLLNVNYGRDYRADILTDLVAVREGDPCPRCAAKLRAERGVEVGNIFQLGTRYSEALGATFLDSAGRSQPLIMGSYGIGVGRLLACIAEEHHDEHGLKWPVSVAPFPVHLVRLAGKGSQETIQAADDLYAALAAAGIEALYDDRDESPGIKFNDADLIGLPLRLTVAERSLKAGGAEMKLRGCAEKTLVPLDEVIARVKQELAKMAAEIEETVVGVDYL
ncbi:MAG: proline--tRNA ligase [Anaerolineaceae bacterium]|nr:proline--tRNA ligase [Anaerolineaceae bacterium]